jgi:hypothetical protein
MNATGLLYAFGSAPVFAARPFLAGFLTALLARYGEHVPYLEGSDLVRGLSAAPDWFTSGACVAVLGVLALLEFFAADSAEARATLEEFEGWIKAGVSLLVSLAVLDADSAEVLRGLQRAAALEPLAGAQQLGFFDWIGASAAAGGTWVLVQLRRGALALVFEIDEDDDVGLLSLVSWAETSWTFLWMFVLLLLPLVALALSALTALALYVLRRRAAEREQRARVPCAQCSEPVHPSAPRCARCGSVRAEPRAVGVFGQPKDSPAPAPEQHRFELVARKRCPCCAERLRERAVRQTCTRCGTLTFANQRDFDAYLEGLERRLPRTLLVCLGLGAIPLVGVIPGVAYYRLTLVTGLRGYIPPLRGCLTRWTVRFLNWGIIALQPIPGIGALVLPLMAWSNYAIYRRALRERAEGELRAPALAAPAAPAG